MYEYRVINTATYLKQCWNNVILKSIFLAVYLKIQLGSH